ncbi:MAG: hypothetical protein JXR25_12365 [Pontiellaceae bacterium]|nr:hypothetical protein [Pontiellaceae bacterium]MBN2785609.1 hypothetical protein [Pontiellaceae bacterium]
MKKLLIGSMALGLAVASNAALIDDFSDADVSEYTATVILDANGGSANTFAVQSPSGSLELSTTVYDGIEQMAIIRNGLSLSIGEEVQVDVVHTGASQDIGLYVGGLEPTAGLRSTYVSVYARAGGELFSRGFNGTSELGQVGWISPAYTTLFIARTAENDYELGYYLADDSRNIMVTREGMTGNDGSYVGFYTDVRAAGTLGSVDNLSVIPEPATFGLLGVFGTALLVARRRFRK